MSPWKLPSLLLGFVIIVVFSLSGSAQAYPPAQEVGPSEAQPSFDWPDLQSAGVLPAGERPFLTAKPFASSYQAHINLSSFFDHSLPLYTDESDTNIPTDLRESVAESEQITQLFTGEERSWFGLILGQQQGYAFYSGHNGIDYRLTGRILAPADGYIAARLSNPDIAGSYCGVYIRHEASEPSDGAANDYTTYYLHMRRLGDAPENERNRPDRRCGTSAAWCEGDTIHQGDWVGDAGDEPCEGISEGVHLHFGVYRGDSTSNTNALAPLDPFGWWSDTADPWADARLTARHGTSSAWVWAAPRNPGSGQPGAWDNGVVAQTDDTDASFQKFGQLTRDTAWRPVQRTNPPHADAGLRVTGSGAWRSTSIASENATIKANWAVWGLHVPQTGEYALQAYVPDVPSGAPAATNNAIYTVRIPLENGNIDEWTAAVDQTQPGGWRDIDPPSGTLRLRADTVILVALSDVTGTASQSVLFDALRLVPLQTIPDLPVVTMQKVGFVIDNSTSMREIGKNNAVKDAIPPWIDRLAATTIPYLYGMVPFADNVPPVQVTTSSDQMKGWVEALDADDNNYPNFDCPEASLQAVQALAPYISQGNILLFTDDLPHNPVIEGPKTFLALSDAHASMHAIILPKTCGYASPIDFEVYRWLALLSGGTYQVVQTSQTSQALEIVLNQMTDNTGLLAMQSMTLSSAQNANLTAALSGVVAMAGTLPLEVLIDESISSASFFLNVLDGELTLELLRPDGSIVQPTDPGVMWIDSGSGKYYKIDQPAVGNWIASISGTGSFVFRSTGNSTIEFAYLGDSLGAPGDVVRLAARVTGPVVQPVFELVDATNAVADVVTLTDDGQQGDLTAGDGIYTGYYVPAMNGEFSLRMRGSTAGGNGLARSDAQIIRVRGLSVEGPEAAIHLPGTWAEYLFVVRNTGSTMENITLRASSSFNWEIGTNIPSFITLAPNEQRELRVQIYVPDDTPGQTLDVVSLQASLQSDVSVVHTASALLQVPDFDTPAFDQGFKSFLPLIER